MFNKRESESSKKSNETNETNESKTQLTGKEMLLQLCSMYPMPAMPEIEAGAQKASSDKLLSTLRKIFIDIPEFLETNVNIDHYGLLVISLANLPDNQRENVRYGYMLISQDMPNCTICIDEDIQMKFALSEYLSHDTLTRAIKDLKEEYSKTIHDSLKDNLHQDLENICQAYAAAPKLR